ncbi:MAG: 50S ribosomal protein L9 [Gammaproteobacteria bacterium]|jgi:large subunit ribosomal protein L9
MEIILLEKIDNLGAMGDRVKVKPGYGRNYLVPKGKAKPATPENIAAFEAMRAELEQAAATALASAESRREKLLGMSITIAANAGDEGKLFGSVGTADIADAITAQGVEIDRHEVRLPNGVFRQVGEYEVQLHLHADVDATIQLSITPE